ncbi:MAG: hypothetical protein K1X64_14470 [Myxococcaceae bacterium]|nr:hypothetical protein [Myxococcaceae bacterium]
MGLSVAACHWLLFVAAAVADAGAPEASSPLAFSALAVEMVPLPKINGPVTLRVSSLEAQVTLEAPADARKLAAHFGRPITKLCTLFASSDTALTFRCRTRRVSADLERVNAGWVMTLRELRGLPWRPVDDGPPATFFAPEQMGAGAACPGDTVVGKAECALRQGQKNDALRLFHDALATPEAPFAAVRLGDLALRDDDDPIAAATWFQRAGVRGPWGRLATARLCELTGLCLTTKTEAAVFDSVALPAPAAHDLALRAMRAKVSTDRTLEAMTQLERALAEPAAAGGLCDGNEPLCRSLVLAGLRDDDAAARRQALQAYLRLPLADFRTALARAAASAAARVAADQGAPRYAATLLASMTGQVPKAELEDHLNLTARLFLDAGDEVRAAVIVDFARARLGKARLQRPVWKELTESLLPHKPAKARPVLSEASLQQIEQERELAEALLAKSRATLVPEPPAPK